MANVNFFELEACLSSLLAYFDKHPREASTALFQARVVKVDAHLRETIETTDRIYNKWRVEGGEERLAYKHLQKAVKAAQRQLAALDAVGYPTQVVSYWDQEDTLEAAQQMLAFLKEHREDLDFADESLSEIQRLLNNVEREGEEVTTALAGYREVSSSRKLAMEIVQDIIKEVRPSMRREFGRDSEAYKSIRWPAMLDPDPM